MWKFIKKKSRVEKDKAELSQAMIIISGLAVAGVTVTGAVAGASLTKGEESSRCISDFSTFDSGASSSDCSTVADNSGTLPPAGEDANATPGEPIEKEEPEALKPEDCFKMINNVLVKYLIVEHPEFCGKDVVIPATIDGVEVKRIGVDAFHHGKTSELDQPEAYKINTVVIPDSVERIDMRAFHKNNLSFVDVPSSVNYIFMDAFSRNNIESVVLRNSGYIDTNAFRNNKLKAVSISNKITQIGEYAFANNEISNPIYLHDGIKTLGRYAFSKNNISTVTHLPEGMTRISEGLFADNPNLTEVKGLPKGLTTIERGAFRNASLKSLAFPSTLSTIGNEAFINNDFTRAPTTPNLKHIGTGAFAGNNIGEGQNSYLWTAPNSLESIGYAAFSGNVDLDRLTIRDNVKTIDNKAFSGTGIKSVVIPPSVELHEGAFDSNVTLTRGCGLSLCPNS